MSILRRPSLSFLTNVQRALLHHEPNKSCDKSCQSKMMLMSKGRRKKRSRCSRPFRTQWEESAKSLAAVLLVRSLIESPTDLHDVVVIPMTSTDVTHFSYLSRTVLYWHFWVTYCHNTGTSMHARGARQTKKWLKWLEVELVRRKLVIDDDMLTGLAQKGIIAFGSFFRYDPTWCLSVSRSQGVKESPHKQREEGLSKKKKPEPFCRCCWPRNLGKVVSGQGKSRQQDANSCIIIRYWKWNSANKQLINDYC